MKRVFCFGCSFTNWYWPTWAKILEQHLQDYEVYNLGFRGISNQGIAYTVTLADEKYKFTDDDIIIIVWSSVDRIDYYFSNEHGEGSLSALGCRYSNDYDSDQVIDSLLNSAFVIQSINKAYNIALNGFWMLWDQSPANCDPWLPIDYELNTWKERQISHPNSYYNVVGVNFGNDHDGHPFPLDHLKYVNDIILPKVFNMAPITELDKCYAYVEEEQEWLLAITADRPDMTHDVFHETIHEHGKDHIYSPLFNELYTDADMFKKCTNIIDNVLFK